jgi:hypothetical protein
MGRSRVSSPRGQSSGVPPYPARPLGGGRLPYEVVEERLHLLLPAFRTQSRTCVRGTWNGRAGRALGRARLGLQASRCG